MDSSHTSHQAKKTKRLQNMQYWTKMHYFHPGSEDHIV